MTGSSDAGIKLESSAAMSASGVSVGTSPTGNEASSTAKASTIIVKTKTPTTATFPPPKTDKPRPHVCTTCQRSFARLEHLKRHERSHTKEKPFECPECARCFARRDLLLRHQQKLHQTTTPSLRPRRRGGSANGAAAGASRARKTSAASANANANAAAAAAAAAAVTTVINANADPLRPRANTISHIDGTMQMIASANANVAPAHSRHPSLVGLPMHSLDHGYAGMASAMSQRGMGHGLPKLDTHAINTMDFPGGLRTAPPMGVFNPDFGFEGLLFGHQGSTINPNALHYNDSPQSMALDTLSPFSHRLPHMSGGQPLDDGWLMGFEQHLSFNTAANETAVGGSSPSAMSTNSQSGISDIMLDGSNHPPTTAGPASIWRPAVMAPPPVTNPFHLDLGNSVFPDLMNGAPLSPQIKTEGYFSTPPPSLSSLSPAIISGLNTQNLGQTLNFGAGPETPSSMSGSSHGSSPVATITDSTRHAILGALSASQAPQLAGRRYSFATDPSPMIPHQPTPVTGGDVASLPSTQDLQRFVGAYLRYFQAHVPFLHVPTLSFDVPAGVSGWGHGGNGCLLLSMSAIGALYEHEEQTSRDLFGLAKKMIQVYLDDRRKTSVRQTDFRRHSVSDPSQRQETPTDAPVWLVQAMLLNVVYGHNCGDKRTGEIATTHAAALVSLAEGAKLLKPVRVDPEDQRMVDDGVWAGFSGLNESEQQAEWLRWKTMEERKRTLYVIFIVSSLLVSAYNHAPALTNSEILLDLPGDEDFFTAETAAGFFARGGVAAANHNRMTFHEALGTLLKASERQQSRMFHSSSFVSEDMFPGDQKPSTFGCLVLINALHNYIWETRQRHHNKVWTNEETEKVHRHIEPALKAWHAVWASDPRRSAQRPNPFGLGPLSADAMALLDLAYVRLFINFSRAKEKFWQRDWEGVADELSRDGEIVQHVEHSPASISTDPSDTSRNSSIFLDSPPTQSSSPEYVSAKVPPAMTQSQHFLTHSPARSSSRREKHLRKAAFYAADSLSLPDKFGLPVSGFSCRDLPLPAVMCAFDCAQVLAEWVATVQDRVGRYVGVLGRRDVDQVPTLVFLEEEDVKLLGKIQHLLENAELKMNMERARGGGVGRCVPMDDQAGYATNILRMTAFMLELATMWPVTRLMALCLETHANRMQARAEKVIAGRGVME